MSNDNKEFTPKGEETIREEVIKDFNLNSDEQKELVDKITSERLEAQKNLGKAIEQKIQYRERKNFYKSKVTLNSDKDKSDKSGESDDKSKDKVDFTKFLTKEEFEKSLVRNRHAYLTDDEFSFISAYAKGSGKKFEECLSNEIVKNYLETNKAQERIVGATGSPSTRYKSSSENKEDKIAKEFDRGLPPGFAPKKK